MGPQMGARYIGQFGLTGDVYRPSFSPHSEAHLRFVRIPCCYHPQVYVLPRKCTRELAITQHSQLGREGQAKEDHRLRSHAVPEERLAPLLQRFPNRRPCRCQGTFELVGHGPMMGAGRSSEGAGRFTIGRRVYHWQLLGLIRGVFKASLLGDFLSLAEACGGGICRSGICGINKENFIMACHE